MIQPESLAASRGSKCLEIAARAAQSAGVALISVRGKSSAAVEAGDQLKTSADSAAEGWVLGWLEAEFPGELVLAVERQFDTGGWAPASTYWTADALDGTRSFIEGYPGFCVQVGWVENGSPRAGVIAEPVTGRVYAAAQGYGAWRIDEGRSERLEVARNARPLRFVDSVLPQGVVGDWMRRESARFVECGSCGLKIARIAEGTADVYAKRFRFRLWDVAPGQILLEEAGGRLGQWGGAPIDFASARVEWDSLLVASAATFAQAVAELDRWAATWTPTTRKFTP